MRKPVVQWSTPKLEAVRIERPDDVRFAADARAERFELRFHDGRCGSATFGLELQLVDAASAEDPGVAFAARAWLAARGQRSIALHVEGAGAGPIKAGAFSVTDFTSPAIASNPARLITLSPSNAEMVDALGCFDRVVACDASSDYPPGIDGVERLGQDLAPDIDRIAELAPDLVVSSLTVPGMERVVTALAVRGIPQIVLAPKTFDDVLDDARRLAQALGVAGSGNELVHTMQLERAELLRRTADRPRARVYLEWWPKPMFTPGRDCYSNELIALAGGINVFAERRGASAEIAAAELVAAQPDVCFVSWCGVAKEKLDAGHLINRPGLEALNAARTGHVFALDEAFSGRPGPRMLEASRIMADAIEGTLRLAEHP